MLTIMLVTVETPRGDVLEGEVVQDTVAPVDFDADFDLLCLDDGMKYRIRGDLCRVTIAGGAAAAA